MKQYFSNKWNSIKLFFSSFFNKPSKDGRRRLVKNPLTGKFEWTSGEETKFKEVEAPFSGLTTNVVEEKIPSQYDFKCFEPKIGNRFIINFPGIEPFLFNRYIFNGKLSSRKMSNGKTKVREESTVQMYLPVAIDNDLEILKMSKLKNIGTVSIDILDVIGGSVRQIVLKNVKIESVNMYSDMSYDDDDLMAAYVSISHDPREIK